MPNSLLMMMTPRYIKFPLLCCCLIVFCFCEAAEKPTKPYEAIEINPDIFIDQTETLVLHWIIYYRWILETEGVTAAARVLPDSAAVEPVVWRHIHNTVARYIRASQFMKAKTSAFQQYKGLPSPDELQFYWNYLSYDKQLEKDEDARRILSVPVTGLSYEQVLGYCRWKTKMFGNNEWVYCLPTQSDWTITARKLLTETEWTRRIIDSVHFHKEEEHPGFNFKHPMIKPLDRYRFETPIAHQTFFDHAKPYTYDVFGNVSEMTNIKGVAKGGNYAGPAIQAHIDSVQYYDKPERWLGFRCVIKSVKIVEESQRYKVPVEKNEFEDSRDGHRYKTVTMGEQTWMAENLAYKTDSGACHAFGDDKRYVPLYGYLYSWETALKACPNGWRLPDTADYSYMLHTLNITDSITAYKELSVNGSSGFNVLNGGVGKGKQFITNEVHQAAFWLSTENDRKTAYTVYKSEFLTQSIEVEYDYKKNKFAIRCIKE